MNEVVFFSLIIMLIIRTIGLGISFEYYYDLKRNFYFYFIFGWSAAILGNISSLFLNSINNPIILEINLVLNAMFISLSFFILMMGLFSYFLRVNSRYFILICMSIIAIALLLFIFNDYETSITFSVLIMNLSILISFILPLFKLKQFKKIIGKSIRWYYIGFLFLLGYIPISLFISTQDYGYGLYFTDDIVFIILNYTIGIINNLLLIILLIHLEYTISYRQQYKLKDKYSHNLGNIMQVIYSSLDLFKMTLQSEKENVDKHNLDLIEKKCKEASKIIKEIRNL